MYGQTIGPSSTHGVRSEWDFSSEDAKREEGQTLGCLLKRYLTDWTWISRRAMDWYQCDSGSDRKHKEIAPQTVDPQCTRDSLLGVNRRFPDGQTTLTSAILQNDVDGVRDLLVNQLADAHYPLLKQFSTYRQVEITPLNVAVNCGNCACAQLLCEAGADVNAVDEDGYTPLHHAASSGNVSICSLLLRYDASVQPSSSTTSPLHEACKHGHEQTMLLLTQHGGAIGHRDSGGSTALHLAIQNGHSALARTLLDLGADIHCSDNIGRTSLMWACQNGLVDVAKQLVAMGARVNDKDNQGDAPFMFAVQGGSLSLLTRYINAEIPSFESKVDEYLQAMETSAVIFDCLAKAGGDLEHRNKSGNTALCYCLEYCNFAGIVILLKHGAKWPCDLDRYLPSVCTHRMAYSICMYSQEIPGVTSTQGLHGSNCKDQSLNVLQTLVRRRLTHPGCLATNQENVLEAASPVSLQHFCTHVIRDEITKLRPSGTSVLPLIQTLPLPQSLLGNVSFSEIGELPVKNFSMQLST